MNRLLGLLCLFKLSLLDLNLPDNDWAETLTTTASIMNKLSKSQKDEFATAFAMLALYDGGVSFLSVHGLGMSTGTNNDRQQFSAIIQTVLMGSLEYTGAQFAIA